MIFERRPPQPIVLLSRDSIKPNWISESGKFNLLNHFFSVLFSYFELSLLSSRISSLSDLDGCSDHSEIAQDDHRNLRVPKNFDPEKDCSVFADARSGARDARCVGESDRAL